MQTEWRILLTSIYLQSGPNNTTRHHFMFLRVTNEWVYKIVWFFARDSMHSLPSALYAVAQPVRLSVCQKGESYKNGWN